MRFHGRPVLSALSTIEITVSNRVASGAAGDVLVELERDGMEKAMRRVEDQRHRAAAVGEREVAGRNALLHHALDLALHARPVLARACALVGEGVDQQVEQFRIALQLLR